MHVLIWLPNMNDSTIKFGYRQNRSTLELSLLTRVYITNISFEKMLKNGRYFYYGYDSRCKQVMWLSSDSGTILFIEFVPLMTVRKAVNVRG